MLDNLLLELIEVQLSVGLDFNPNDGLAPLRRVGRCRYGAPQTSGGQQKRKQAEIIDGKDCGPTDFAAPAAGIRKR